MIWLVLSKIGINMVTKNKGQ